MLDPCSLFIGNVPSALPEDEMWEWLRYFRSAEGLVKVKMNHQGLGKSSSCIATYKSGLAASIALPRIDGSWTTCTPTRSNRFEARTRIGS